MEMQKQSKFRNIIEYALIVALFYVTGGAFSYTNYSLQIILFFSCAAGLALVFGCLHHFFRQEVLVVWLIQFVCLMLVPIISGDAASSYIAILLQLTIGALCAIMIPFQEFKRKFLRIIVFFATVSLLFFVVSIIYPQIALSFPCVKGDASVDYYNAYIYVFMRPKGFVSFQLSIRNAGICWEPGCYQAFLNIGLIFLLEEGQEKGWRQLWSFMILLLTIFTTMSTAGLILLVCTLIIYWKTWTKRFVNQKYFLMIVLCLIGLVVLLQVLGFVDFITEKLRREFLSSEEGDFWDRISLNRISYVVNDGRYYFFGMSFAKWLTFDLSLWNSVIHSFLCLGTPFTILQLLLYWQGAKVVGKKGWWLFSVMVLCCFTETLFWRVFFNTIAYYGVVVRKKQALNIVFLLKKEKRKGENSIIRCSNNRWVPRNWA